MTQPIPSWLDPTREITDRSDIDVTPEAWVRAQLATLAGLGLDPERAAEAVAHCATECAWGRRAIGHNLGGVKLSERTARAASTAGSPLAWLRSPGHVASGDPEVCYYRAFTDDAAFWRFWLARYVPKPGARVSDDRYVKTGAAFWGPSPSAWFVALILAGYRGPVREREVEELLAKGVDPETHRSVVAHRANVARVRALAAPSAHREATS